MIDRSMEGKEIIFAIREAMKRKGTNPSRLAKENGLSVNAVRYILEGRPPSSKRLAEVCRALDLEFYVGPRRLPDGIHLSADQLADELDRLASEARRMARETFDGPAQIDQSGLYVSAPRYEVLAAAGRGEPVLDEDVKGHLGFNREWLREQRLHPDKLAVIDVRGDSMEPTLCGGDSVLLDMRPQELRDGAIYTLRRDDELIVKRVRRQAANWLIVSDNVAYPVETLTADTFVVGRVVWLGRPCADQA